jgi:hypothetical protein
MEPPLLFAYNAGALFICAPVRAQGETILMNEQLESEHSWIKRLLLGFWLALLAVIFGTKVCSPDIYKFFIKEDSLSEYAQCITYLLSSVFALLIAQQSLKNRLTLLGILYGILALSLFFISMEEISWGQRILGIANPEYFDRHNVQEELTLHNLSYVQPLLRHLYIAIAFYGSFSWILTSVLSHKAGFRGISVLDYVTPPWYVAPYFFVCFCLYTFLHYVRPHVFYTGFGRTLSEEFWFFLHWRDEEHAELFLSLGFLFFTILSYRKLLRHLRSSS